MVSLINFLSSPIAFFYLFGIFVLIMLYYFILEQYMKHSALKVIRQAAISDQMWNLASLEETIKDIFQRYNEAKSKLDFDSISNFLTDNLKKRIELEFSVLQNESRSIRREGLKVKRPQFLRASEADSSIIVWITATATTIYSDISTRSELYRDIKPIHECWKFVKNGNCWLADDIQLSLKACENRAPTDPPKPDFIDGGVSQAKLNIYNFANSNNFCFDPDFGSEMLPDKGALFDQIAFSNSLVSDHVIGKYREKIVEFYRYNYPVNQHVFTIAQAILPREYQQIIIQPKQAINWSMKNLNKIETESTEFNREFNLYAHDLDQANSFELLAPNFIEKVLSLKFKMSVEVIGNYLFLYTDDNRVVYDEMLEIINWAFDEMKM